MVRHRVEQHVSPEIIEAWDATARALREVEEGWQRAQNAIGKRAGLVQGADGTWSQSAKAMGDAAQRGSRSLLPVVSLEE
jgi:hypothetical protein